MAPGEPQLHELAEAFRSNGATAHDLAAPLTPAQFIWKPAPHRWSVGECLAHLNATADAYILAMEAAVDDAVREDRRGSGPFRAGLLGGWFAAFLEPPPRIRVRSSIRRVREGERPERTAVLRTFAEHRGRFLDLLERMEGLALGRIRIRSPFQPLVRFNAYAALLLVAAHERRHLHQIRGVLSDPGFPAAAGA